MKTLTILLAAFAFQVLSSGSLHAQQYEYGVGIIIGEPTGLSGKLWWSDNTAFDAGLAWSFADETEISLHGDLLLHNWELLRRAFGITGDTTDMPLYYGFGARLKAGDNTRLGIRFPIGAALVFPNYPIDFFVEIAPIMDVVPDTEIRGNASIGFRFWF